MEGVMCCVSGDPDAVTVTLWTHLGFNSEMIQMKAGYHCCSTKDYSSLSIQVYAVYLHWKYMKIKVKIHNRHRISRQSIQHNHTLGLKQPNWLHMR